MYFKTQKRNLAGSRKKMAVVLCERKVIHYEYYFSGFEYPESKSIYEDANKRIEKWTERIKFLFTTLPSWIMVAIFIATFVITAIIKYTKGLDNFEYTIVYQAWWVLVFKQAYTNADEILQSFSFSLKKFYRFPFDRNTFPLGYTLASCFEVTFTILGTYICGISFNFLNGSRIILTAYIEDIKQELRSLNDRLKSERPNQTDQLKLVEIINLHLETKQLSPKSKQMLI